MLLLQFEIGNGRYALETNSIIEIVPLVNLKKIPTSPAYVAGLMNYRGEVIPVIPAISVLFPLQSEARWVAERVLGPIGYTNFYGPDGASGITPRGSPPSPGPLTPVSVPP